MRKFKLLLLCIPIVVCSQVVYAEEELEEVVVTGSYLKRTAADSASPLSVMTAGDIEDIGAADIAEIVQSMPWSSGSQTRAATFQGEGADGRNTINLRNLGHGSTLPLVNGKRQVPSWYNGRGNASVNINGLIPNLAIERIEIVKDGASALYGSDAIAGVVNFITKRNFEGMDFSAQFTTDDQTGKGDASNFEVIWGVQGDRGGIVLSASYLNREEINVDDYYSRYGGSTLSSTGQPGRLTPIAGEIVTWAANGLFPGEQVGANGETTENNLPRAADGSSYGQADVNCEDAIAVERGGAIANFLNRCVYDYGSFFSIQSAEQLRKIHVDGHYDLSDDMEMYFEFASNVGEFDRLNSLNPNAPALTIPTEVTYTDGDGVLQTVPNPGSVEDAFRRGIEPVAYANLTRMMGGTRNTPKEFRPLNTFTIRNRTDERYLVGVDWDLELGGKPWNMDLSYTASQHWETSTQQQDTLSTHMELALNGRGGPNCDLINGVPGSGNQAFADSGGDFGAGACYFFNPFGNNMYDRDGNRTKSHDLTLVNPDELYTWLQGKASSAPEYTQRVIDLVFAGELFEMPAGPMGLAVGFQRRRDTGQVLIDSSLSADNLDFVFGATQWKSGLTTTAYFAELGVPLMENLEVNFAVRYEDFDELGVDTTDPKISVLWQPLDSLSLRASWGSSFRVPTLQQTSGFLTTVSNQTDVVGGTTYKPSITEGNANLKPEEADSWNLGISWQPEGFLDGLAIDLDFWDYDYTDIITRESTTQILAADNAALDAYIAANEGSTYVDAVNAGTGNREQVIRNSQAIMLRVLPNFSNAQSATASGVDLNSSYSFETNWGSWRVGLQAAYFREYEVTQADGTVTDAVGSYNFANTVARPLPELLWNATLSWSMNNHRAFMIVKYVDDVDEDIPAGTAWFFQNVTAAAGNTSTANDMNDGEIEEMYTVDVNYSYNFGELGFLSDSNITVGIMNVADEEAPVVSYITGFDPRLHDGRGRMFMVRVGGSF